MVDDIYLIGPKERIRDKLQSDARRHFADACALDPSECDSLVALVQSHMHVSVQRLLAS